MFKLDMLGEFTKICNMIKIIEELPCLLLI